MSTEPVLIRRNLRRAAWAFLALVLLALAGAALLVARDARTAQGALDAAATRVAGLQQAISAGGDPTAASAQLAALRHETSTARDHTDGPLWTLGAHLPVVGPNLDAVTRICAALDDVADDVAPALVDLHTAVSGMQREADGTFPLGALSDLAPGVTAARTTMDAATASLASIDPTRLWTRLAGPLTGLRTRLGDVASAVATADRAATLVPAMLGASGPRTYLVLALTNAELRAGGGVPGAVVLLRADGGRITVVRQVAGTGLPVFTPAVAALDPETTAVFSDRPARFIQDVTMTPEFPSAAALAARMWARSQGEQVDGVVAADPVALAELLSVTGPVEVPLPAATASRLGSPSFTIGTSNAVEVLEHGVYTSLGLDPEQADAFFGALVTAVAERLGSSGAGTPQLVAALASSTAQHRVQVWSAHPAEQARLAGTALAGTFLSAPGAADAVGVFLDDAVAGKMSWFLTTSVAVESSQCTATGRLDTVDVTLTSTAPADAATSLPAYVAGVPGGAVSPGTVQAVLRLAGPVGSPAVRAERDGHAFGMVTQPLRGRLFSSGTITLAPGQSATVRFEVRSPAAVSSGDGPHAARTLDVWSTPTAHDGGLHTAPAAACRAP